MIYIAMFLVMGGLNEGADAIWSFITTLVTDFLSSFLTSITVGLFERFVEDILGGFSAATIFSLLLAVVAFAFFMRYVWVPLMWGD